MRSDTAPPPDRLVTDAPVRVFHALFASGFAVAWLTGDADGWRALHVTLGYSLAGLLAWRLAYGWFGPPPARLGPMLRRLGGLRAWLVGLWRDPAARSPADHGRQGLTLLVGALPTLLLLGLPFLALSGVATHLDWGGGEEVFEEVHEVLANGLGLIALLHPLLVLAQSAVRGRNLARTMWSGRVAGPGPDLVRRERRGAALLLALAVTAGAWAVWQVESAREPIGQGERHGDDRHHERGGHDDD